jgi:hypothetical protein
VSCRKLPVNGRNWGRGGFAVSWIFDRNGGRRGEVLSFRELPKNVRNEEREGRLSRAARIAEIGGGKGLPRLP